MSEIITFYQFKGGVGKSTFSVNVPVCLSRYHEKKVLVVDLDPQGNTTSGFGIDKDDHKTLFDVIKGDIDISNVIVKLKDVDLIPSNEVMKGLETFLVHEQISRESFISDILRKLTEYDYIILDCPGAFGLVTINSLVASDYVYTPCQCTRWSIDGLDGTFKSIKIIKQRLNQNLELGGIIPNIYDGREATDVRSLKLLHDIYKDKVVRTIVRRDVKTKTAQEYDLNIFDYTKGRFNQRDIKDLTEEILIKTLGADYE